MFLNKIKKGIKFSEIPARDKKKILAESIREANKEQRKLVEQYDRKYGKLKHAN